MDRKKEYSRRKKIKKFMETESEADTYYDSSLSSSGEEGDEEVFLSTRKKKKSKSKFKSDSKYLASLEKYSNSPLKPTKKSKSLSKKESSDEDELYRSDGKVSLQTMSALNNSRTILQALQSLQSKIKSLEEERDQYKKRAEGTIVERQREEDKRKEDRLLFLKDKEALMKERNVLSEELIRSQEKISQLEIQLSQFESHTSSLRDDIRDLQVTVRDKEDRTMEFSRKIIELEKLLEMEKKKEGEQNLKIEELSRFVVKERRRVERLEDQNNRLNVSIKNLVGIEKKSGNKKGKAVKKKKKKKGGKGTSSRRIVGRKIGGKMPSTIKKKKFYTSTKASFGNLTSQSRQGKKSSKGGARWKPGKGTMKERLYKANLHRDVPFMSPGTSKSSFNANCLAQTGLNVGVSNNGSKSKNQQSKSLTAESPYSDTTESVRSNPSSGMNDSIEIGGDRHAQSVLFDLRQEYDGLENEYQDLLNKIKTGEEVRVTQKIRVISELMKRKKRQMERLSTYRDEVNSSVLLQRPYVRGAKKRVKTLKLFRNLKKIVNT